MKQIGIKEAVSGAFLSMIGLEKKEEEPLECQVMNLVEVIQKIQQRVIELELQTVPSTPQEEHDQREMISHSTVERIKALIEECKQLSSRIVQIHENLTENPEFHKLELQLQEAKHEAEKLQVYLKALSPLEKMKQSHEKHIAQQHIHII
jgi:hypothetical protein